MTLEYVNRRGDRYYVLQGETKTGKPKYYCAKKPNAIGKRIDELPPGFEIYEQPENAAVGIRKKITTRIQLFEKEMLIGLAKELVPVLALVDVTGDSLALFASNSNPARIVEILGAFSGSAGGDEFGFGEWALQHAKYTPMLRFTLIDEDKRIYLAERWCYRGSIDDWIELPKTGTLESLARTYFPHVGKESFYELY